MRDIFRGDPVREWFFTVTNANVPITLAGSPVAKAFIGTGTAGVTTGVSLSIDAGSITGSHLLTVLTTDQTVYIPGSQCTIKLTAGTVDGDSVVGSVLTVFTIEGANDGRRYEGQAQGVAAQGITLASADTETAAGNYIRILTATTGAQQWGQVASISGPAGTLVATMDRAWAVALTGTVIYRTYPGSLPLTAAEQAAATLLAATATPIASDIKLVNAITLQGTGVPTSDPWEPA